MRSAQRLTGEHRTTFFEAWSFYSENEAHGRINVDMLRTVRVVEELDLD